MAISSRGVTITPRSTKAFTGRRKRWACDLDCDMLWCDAVHLSWVTFVGLQSWVLLKPRRKSFTWEGKSWELKRALWGLSLMAHVYVHGYSQSNKHSFHLMANHIKNSRWVTYLTQVKPKWPSTYCVQDKARNFVKHYFLFNTWHLLTSSSQYLFSIH